MAYVQEYANGHNAAYQGSGSVGVSLGPGSRRRTREDVRMGKVAREIRKLPGILLFWILVAAEEIGALLRRSPDSR
ncbi:MAG: hypothetical protein JWR80_9553 [Bradyrhizobium sp.]|nr:hypothetical protein [Bradyrhizobium sp.]